MLGLLDLADVGVEGTDEEGYGSPKGLLDGKES